ncbi:MAG: tRNA (5-methylaminomethyl-2-thiouridine)(34)-methyltransferase MnmD [Flavobacteriaceae bacterium]|nr:tRNA (5-methylaminomethyl-2-thiouridine)(34)-methyltransferase MnmD [Flavobacteriaceae bacterium]
MKREIKITADGSTTIHLPDWGESYHSTHGAIQEAKHVFIKHGFNNQPKENVAILEIGFGTGLNCFITYLENLKKNSTINYVGVEAYPVTKIELQNLNYVSELQAEQERIVFEKIHAINWEEEHKIAANFSLIKRQQFFKDINDKNTFDIIYFDAFGPRHQPKLWTASVFEKMFEALKPDGILVTYSAKGAVRRTMQEVGFMVERLPGPPGKREMLRAKKV